MSAPSIPTASRADIATARGRSPGDPPAATRSLGLLGAVPLPLLLLALAAAIVASVVISVGIGAVPIPAERVARILLHDLTGGALGGRVSWSATEEQIVWNFRAPRVLLAVVVGAGLAVAGTTMQAVVRNPLADPYILGVSAGAALGAVLVIVLGAAAVGGAALSTAAFLGALGAFALVYLLSQQGGRVTPTRLVLAGVALSYLFSSGTSFLVLKAASAQDNAAQTILFWLLGSVAAADWSSLGIPAAVVLVTVTLLLSVHPDFVFDNDPAYFYDASQGFATRQQLRAAGAKIFTISARCNSDTGNPKATIEDVYTDILNLGRIFGVEARARQVVAGMRAQVASVHRRVLAYTRGRAPLRVLVYTVGRGPIGVATGGIYRDELRLAGAASAINSSTHDIELLNKEVIAASNPDAFMVLDSPNFSATAGVQFLLNTFPNTPAGRHKRVIVILYQRVNPGGENPLAVQDIARALYPGAFK